jgi:transcription initiation factor TFIID subunit 5
METDKLVGKNSDGLGNNEHILDGSAMKDYSLSFSMLVDMVDTTLDDYKSDLQQILFPIFTILYITMIRRNFEKGANQFFKEHEPLFKSNNT